MDFTVFARLEGTGEGLAAAFAQGGQQIDAFQAKAAGASKAATAAANEIISAEKAKAAAIAATGRELEAATGKLSTFQKTQLGFQLNDVFTQLASGQGVLRTAVQQGPQITQIFGGIANTFRAIPAAAIGAVAAIGLVSGAVALGTAAYDAATKRAQSYEVQLAALGRASQTNAGQITGSIDALAGKGGFDRDKLAGGTQAFFDQGVFNSGLVERGLRSARDLALALGSDLAPQAKAVAEALTGTGNGVEQLDSRLRFLTDSERQQVRALQEMGRTTEAAGLVLDALGRRLDGLGDKTVTTGGRISASIGEAWSRALENFGKTAPVQGAASAIKTLGDALADGLGPRAGGAAQQLAEIDAQLLQIQLRGGAFQPVRDRLQQNLLVNQALGLQDQLAQNAGQGYGADGNPAQRAEEEAKKVRELVEQLDALSRQRDQLHNVIARIGDDMERGAGNADLWAKALDQLQGKLDGLRSPLERSQDALDVAAALAGAPRAQRAALANQQQAERDAQSLPPSQRDEFVYNQRQAFRLQFDQETRDQLDDLDAAARNLLAGANSFAGGLSGALRQQAIGDASERARTGSIGAGAAGAYAQGLLNQRAAGAVFDFAGTTQGYREQTEALQRLVAAEAQGSAAAREAQRQNEVTAATSKLRAAVEAAGSDEIAQAARKQIDAYNEISRAATEAQRRREAQQFNQQFDPEASYQQQILRLRDLQATGLLTERAVAEATKQYELQRYEASRDATDGMIAGLKRYADEATNAGYQAAQGVRSAMSSAEDAVAQFATKGRIDVGNLANSIIADMARIAARKYVLGPLADAFGNVLGNIFGSSTAGKFNLSADGASSMHGGGVVGDIPYMTRNVPMSVFRNARRYHEGGVVLGANEVPIIAQRGERVLTKDQQAGAGGVSIQVNVIDNAGVKVSTSQRTGAGGVPTLDILVEQLEGAMASKVRSGRGDLFSAIGETYGVAMQGRGG